jgi:hypothetical protein
MSDDIVSREELTQLSDDELVRLIVDRSNLSPDHTEDALLADLGAGLTFERAQSSLDCWRRRRGKVEACRRRPRPFRRRRGASTLSLR